MGFTPISEVAQPKAFRPGFTPLEDIQAGDEQPSTLAPAVETLRDIGKVYPVLEATANLATQAVAMPVAGIAGLGAAASNAMGLTDAEPADVVHKVSGALTYQPHTKSGQHLTGAATYPFQKLAEAGRYVGGKTLDATGSPALATAVDTAVNVAPMAFMGKSAEPKGVLTRAADRHIEQQAQAVPSPVAVETPPRQTQPGAPIETVQARNAQEAITQPMPIAEVSQAPAMPRTQVADTTPFELGAVE